MSTTLQLWAIMPTANTAAARPVIAAWQQVGCRVAAVVDRGQERPSEAEIVWSKEWKGYPDAINSVCRGGQWKTPSDETFTTGLPIDVAICVADDLWPDPHINHAAKAAELFSRFPDGVFVMQPTGDQYGDEGRAAVSPWIGRGWLRRAYGGRGPYFDGYYHLWSDRELADVARACGRYVTDPAITQKHVHWSRPGNRDNLTPAKRQAIIDGQAADKALYHRRLREGFPGASPLL